MTDPIGDEYDRYRPQQEQPTQTIEPVSEQQTQTMPMVYQEIKLDPYQDDGQDSMGPDPDDVGIPPARWNRRERREEALVQAHLSVGRRSGRAHHRDDDLAEQFQEYLSPGKQQPHPVCLLPTFKEDLRFADPGG